MESSTYHHLDHHAAVRARKATCTGGVDELADDCPSPLVWLAALVRLVKTHETKNIDTPVPPRSLNTPAAGKMIMPSANVCQSGALEGKGLDTQDMPSRTLSNVPRITAGNDLSAVVASGPALFATREATPFTDPLLLRFPTASERESPFA